MVKEIFSSIHHRYDVLNHVLSLGCDFYWRKFVTKHVKAYPQGIVLDMASGTGDLALALVRAHPQLLIIGADFSWPMLKIAREKLSSRGLSQKIKLIRADALKLPFPENRFDAVTVAFGIRNMSPISEALRELKRVLKMGGEVFILEMHNPPHFLPRLLFHLYSRTILKVGARFLSPNPSAYDYLVNSILQFPSPGEFKKSMHQVGFEKIQQYALFPGITYLHAGVKLDD